MKRNWKRTRKFILRIPTLDKKSRVRPQEEIDDNGRDFLLEMAFIDAVADAQDILDNDKLVSNSAAAAAAAAAAVAAAKAPSHHDAGAKTEHFEKKVGKVDKCSLGLYMKKGYSEDKGFKKLVLRWTIYDSKTRVEKMKKMKIQQTVFECCVDQSSQIHHEQNVTDAFFAVAGSKRSLKCALKYLLKERSRM